MASGRNGRLLGCWTLLGVSRYKLGGSGGGLLVPSVASMSPPSGPFTFSQPLASSAALAEALHRRAREQMLGFRASLSGVSDAASAQTWVSDYGAAMVRPCLFIRSSGVLILLSAASWMPLPPSEPTLTPMKRPRDSRSTRVTRSSIMPFLPGSTRPHTWWVVWRMSSGGCLLGKPSGAFLSLALLRRRPLLPLNRPLLLLLLRLLLSCLRLPCRGSRPPVPPLEAEVPCAWHPPRRLLLGSLAPVGAASLRRRLSLPNPSGDSLVQIGRYW